MDKFLKKHFSSIKNIKKKKLPGDGGHRSYTRIKDGEKTFILMSCGKKDISLKKFVEIQKRIAPFVSVPQIFQKSFEEGFLLLEDLGDQSLEQFFLKEGTESSLQFYKKALIQLIHLQSNVDIFKNDLLFDKKFFFKEIEMSIHHLNTYIHNSYKKINKIDEKLSSGFKEDMKRVISNFKMEDYVYCHRDYHSRNLMLKNDQVVIIDFQDAGIGPWCYDLASLLYDCYVPLNLNDKKKLFIFYFENLPLSLKSKVSSLSQIEFMIKLQFLQRGFKACGRFAAFKNLNQKSTHLKYIYPTLQLMKKTSLELSYLGIHEYLKNMIQLLESFSSIENH